MIDLTLCNSLIFDPTVVTITVFFLSFQLKKKTIKIYDISCEMFRVSLLAEKRSTYTTRILVS